METINIVLLILLSCWCVFSIQSNGDLTPSQDPFLWCLSAISIIVCFACWIYNFIK